MNARAAARVPADGALRTAWTLGLALLIVALLAVPAHAGAYYGWTISSSSTDPTMVDDVATGGGTRILYLWLACNLGDGLTGAEFQLEPSGGVSFLNFSAYLPFVNSGSGPNIILFTSGGSCVSGPTLAGEIQITDSGPGAICIGPSTGGANASFDCQAFPEAWPNDVVSWRTDGGFACRDVPCEPDLFPDFPNLRTNEGSPADVEITVDAGVGVSLMTLYYRSGGENGFRGKGMFETFPGTWHATIPGEHVTRTGVQYYAIADGTFFTVRLPEAGYQNVEVEFQEPAAYTLPSGEYALMSLPFEANGNAAPTVIFDELGPYDTRHWRYGTWSGDGYRDGPGEAADALPGRGFWIYAREGTSIGVSGSTTDLSEDFVVWLTPGWNLIGNPFPFDVPASAVLRGPGVIADFVSWEGDTYRHLNQTVRFGHGYWIFNGSGSVRTLTFPAEFVPAAPRTALPTPTWDAGVEIAVDGRTTSRARFGLHETSAPGTDELDLRAAPGAPGASARVTFRATGRDLYRDVRGTAETGARWELAVESPGDRDAVVTVTDLERLPETWSVYGADVRGASRWDLRERPAWTVAAGSGPTTWWIVAGPEDWAADRLDETVDSHLDRTGRVELTLGPNPVRGSEDLLVSLLLPEASHAEVRLFDVTGRQVRRIASESLPRGRHEWSWSPREASAAAGIYFLQARVGTESITRKVTVLDGRVR